MKISITVEEFLNRARLVDEADDPHFPWHFGP
jgi:hypothetical protein